MLLFHVEIKIFSLPPFSPSPSLPFLEKESKYCYSCFIHEESKASTSLRNKPKVLSQALYFFLNFLCVFLRESEHTGWEGQREKGGDTESEAGTRLPPVRAEPNTRLKPTNHKIMT